MKPAVTLDPNDVQGPARVTGRDLAAISTGLVQLYARHGGKGPTKAKTHISGDTVICVFREPYTLPEQTLNGRGERVAAERMREGLHRVIEEEARRIVEAGCRRKVIACLAATHVDPDLIVQIFVLEPDDRSGS